MWLFRAEETRATIVVEAAGQKELPPPPRNVVLPWKDGGNFILGSVIKSLTPLPILDSS